MTLPTLTAPPTVPNRGDRTNFKADAQAWTLWEKNYKYPETVAVVQYMASSIAQNAALASAVVTAANDAAASATVALGAANFKGLWTALAADVAHPVLNRPACVWHVYNGTPRFWLLVQDLPNVAAAEPGVSSAWVPIQAGTPITQVVVAGVVNAVIGVRYLLAGASLRINVPQTGWIKGDYIGFRLVVDQSPDQIIDFGALNVMGKPGGECVVNIDAFAKDLTYEDAAIGLA